MPIFTATAAYIAASVGVQSAFGLAAINFGVRMVAAYALTKLIGDRNDQNGSTPGISAPGTQMPPSTDNKLPVVYGTAYVTPCLIDAKMSTDQTTMWYVMAISETTDTGTISFDRVWWGDKELIFDDPIDHTKVTSWINSNDQENTNVNNNMWVYFYKDGSNEPVNTTQSAISVLQDPAIPEFERWTSFNTMTDCVFAIVKIEYTQNASITGIEPLLIQVTNTLTKPGSVLQDYLVNTRYGCGVPLENIDTASLALLDTYSDELISYVPVGGGTATQARYRINGMVNTNNPCMTNLQLMVDCCDSWVQWNEVDNMWSIVINQSYLDYTTYEDLFIINSSNMIGGINVTPVDLNNTYNSVETQFHNTKIKDKSDYAYSVLDSVDRNPNEPDNQLVVQLPYVNNSVQAQYLATRRLIQSREDLFITVTTDYSGIQVEAGDVIRVQHEVYGWGPLSTDPLNPDKLFRVSQVIEAKTEDGSLGTQISMFEYNEQVYENINIEDYTPAQNTGIPDPGWISTPAPPVVTDGTVVDGMMSSLIVTAVVPATGTVLYMDFYYGTSADASTHKLYRTVSPASGRKFTNGETVQIVVNDIPKGTYYWSVKARGATSQGASENQSPSTSTPSTWDSLKILIPALVGSQILGGIATSMMKPSTITDLTGRYNKVSFSPGTLFPETVSTSTWNQSVYIPGSTVSSTNIYPWFQGTDYYSTGPWEPADSRVWPILNGDDGWYSVIGVDLSGNTFESDEISFDQCALTVMTDTPGTLIQICKYIIDPSDLTTYVLQTQELRTYELTLIEPYPIGLSWSNFAQIDTGTVAVERGYMIRNMTSGSIVTIVSGNYIQNLQKLY